MPDTQSNREPVQPPVPPDTTTLALAKVEDERRGHAARGYDREHDEQYGGPQHLVAQAVAHLDPSDWDSWVQAASLLVAALEYGILPPARTPVDDIPVGRENAKPLVVNGVVGTFWIDSDDSSWVRQLDADDDWAASVMTDNVTSVTPLHVIPADLAEEIKAWAAGELGNGGAWVILGDVATALLDGEVSR
jgi:hypothetical protein